MIDHIMVTVKDIAVSKEFYQIALKPLGYRLSIDFEQGGGFGLAGKMDFWINKGDNPTPIHVAFTCPDHITVEAFYKAAIAAGGKDNGPPGPRPQYHPDYYGAFVLDPDGNNVEAVCHAPQ